MAEQIESSALTPMQKLRAIRTKVIPMLFQLIENSSTEQRQLHRFNRALRKIVKRILCLPERAANAYIHLHRMYGGPGIPDLVLLKAKLTLQSFLSAMNLEDELGEYTRGLLLKGKSLSDVILAINKHEKAGLSAIAKEVSASLKRLKTYLESDIDVHLFDGNKCGLVVNNMPYLNPWPVFNRQLQKQSLKLMSNAPNQGRFWDSLSSNPITTETVFNFHTKLCDWRYIHKARLNLIPLKAAMFWNPNVPKTCRRCQAAPETLNHVINGCTTHRKSVIQRHNDIRDQIEKSLPKRVTVLKEQRFGNTQPDLIVQCPEKQKTFILDVKVSAENPEIFKHNTDEILSKYDALKRAFAIQGTEASIHVIQVGSLGSV